MSSNVDVVNGAYANFASGDVPAVIAAVDEAVQWDSPGCLPQGGSFTGPAGVGSFFEAVGANWQELKIDIKQLLDAGDEVVAIGRGQGSLAGGDPAGYGFAHVFTIADGKIIRFREYADPDEAVLRMAGGS
jgi:ketosteroid isomerase-like protein